VADHREQLRDVALTVPSSGEVGEPLGLPRVAADRATWRRILGDVAVVTVTPFSGDRLQAVDHAGMKTNLEHLIRGGVRLLVAGGNTGEFAALSETEVVETVRTHAEVARGRARVIAGIGYRLEQGVDLGRASIHAGADGLMVHYPIHPYVSEPGLLRYYESLAEALPGAPLIAYVRGPQLSSDGVRHLARIGSIVGVKLGVADPARFAQFVAASPDLAWVCGVAESWALPFWRAGAIGFTSGLANFAPERSLEVLEALKAGDVVGAETLIGRLLPIEALRAGRADGNNVAVVKAAMDLVGLVGGDLRPPLSGLDPVDHAELVRNLQNMELLR
jgi:4-hydroxy-tetrahydrodipicolinate synthase